MSTADDYQPTARIEYDGPKRDVARVYVGEVAAGWMERHEDESWTIFRLGGIRVGRALTPEDGVALLLAAVGGW